MSRGHTHDLTLLRADSQRWRDDEGRWHSAGDPVPFRGRIAFRSASRSDRAGGRGEDIAATVQIPHGLNPQKGDKIVAANLPGRDALLNGTWRIDAVSSTPAHVRALCAASTTPRDKPQP